MTDPDGDTQHDAGRPGHRGDQADYGNKRVRQGQLPDRRHLAYATDGGTITGANLKFKNGKSYVLQRHAADPGRQTPLSTRS